MGLKKWFNIGIIANKKTLVFIILFLNKEVESSISYGVEKNSAKAFIELSIQNTPFHVFRLLDEGLLLVYSKDSKIVKDFVPDYNLNIEAVRNLQSYLQRSKTLFKDSIYEDDNLKISGAYTIISITCNNAIYRIEWRSGRSSDLEELVNLINLVLPKDVREYCKFVNRY
jgi:hypothetical protein